MSNTVPGQSRVTAVRNFKDWLDWCFVKGGCPSNYEGSVRYAIDEGSVRYAIERGQDLMLTEEEMAPMHNYLAKRAL